jgi:exo-1,4-beta-D-glucosaminidase
MPITIPATVMAGLLQNGKYPDPLYGLHLLEIPRKQFDVAWWYRNEFFLNSSSPTQTASLTFKGLNYRANIWLNGVQIADSSEIVGTFVYFEVDITPWAKVSNSTPNVIAVEIYRPHDSWTPPDNTDTDLAISFVDWAPFAPDSSMGLWREVLLNVRDGPVSIEYPLVESQVQLAEGAPFSTATASLTVMAEVTNFANEHITGVVSGSIPGVANFSQSVTLKPKERQQVFYSNFQFPQLNLDKPNLWWPWQMGESYLYNLTMSFSVGNVVYDSLDSRFGVREITSKLNSQQYRVYYINNQPILIRGGGWAPDLFLRGR